MTSDNTAHHLQGQTMSPNIYATGDNLEYHSVQWETGLPFSKPLQRNEEEIVQTKRHNSDAIYQNNSGIKDYSSRMADVLSSGMLQMDLGKDSPLMVEVDNPERHGEGIKDSFVTYEVKSTTTLSHYHNATNSVKRRYNDFLWLKRRLQVEYPFSILPPLPEKHRLDYLDRFNPDFVAKRQVALYKFMEHLCIHPLIQGSEILRNFLETPYLPTDSVTKKDSVIENLSDAVLNAFSKLQEPNETFFKIKSSVGILDDHLKVLDKTAVKILQDQRAVGLKMAEASLRYQELHNSSPEMAAYVERFIEVLKVDADELDRLSVKQETGLFSVFKEYIQYCRNAKIALKSRDQRQMDYEDLVEFHRTHVAERDKVQSQRPGHTGNLSGFINKKLDDLKGIDQVTSKKKKLAKLDAKIRELEQAVETSKELSQSFNEQLVKEFQFFDALKTRDFKVGMLDASKSYLEYHTKMHESWKGVLASFD